MAERLEIHPASEPERIQAFRNVHDVWGGGVDLETHVRHRLQSVQHNRATWFVGCLGGRVVTSLGCYPMLFCLNGRVVPGIALGAVHTRAEWRGRRFAPRLIRWVEEYQQDRGATLALLYSDIDPEYYARQGCLPCPSWEGWIDLSGAGRIDVSGQATLIPMETGRSRTELAKLYDDFHAGIPMSVARNAE